MNERRVPAVLIGCLAIVGLFATGFMLLFGAVLYGLHSGHLASIEALPQGKILANQLAEISRIVGLQPNEQILYFYSAAVTVSGDGNLFTNQRVISYTAENGPLDVFDAEYDEIQSVVLPPSGSWLDDSIIEVVLHDGTALTLWVSAEQGRDKAFHAGLMKQLQSHRASQQAIASP